MDPKICCIHSSQSILTITTRTTMMRLSVLNTSSFVLLLILLLVGVNASTDFGVPKSSQIPKWLSIHKDRDKMAEYTELARQRHKEAISKARDSYFSGNPRSDNKFDLDALEFDEYEVKAAGKIPDFSDELERKLFVTNERTPLFTSEECKQVVSGAEEYFSGGEWTTLPSGQYDVAGFWIRDVPAVNEWFNSMVRDRLFPLLVKKFPHFCPNMEDLVVDNAYVFKYTTETGRRTDVHTDSGCLSFTISLNGNGEYVGGGTWFEGLDGDRDVIEMDVGECTVRPGGVKHCGHAVTSGTRYIIGGFCMNADKVEYVRMLMNLGSEESQRENYETAQDALEAAIALNPDFDGPYSHLADVYTKQGKTSKAKEVLEHCFYNVNRDSGEIAYSLGVIYMEEGDHAKARECMDVCLKADDCDVDAMMVMARTCQGINDNAGEEKWYLRLVSTPGAKQETAAKAYCNLGVLNEGTDKEIEYYKKSLELKSDSFPAWYSLGCAYASKNEWKQAVPAFREASDVADDKSDEQATGLKMLYRATMSKVQQDSPQGVKSQEEMTNLFKKEMGEQNFQKLSVILKG